MSEDEGESEKTAETETEDKDEDFVKSQEGGRAWKKRKERRKGKGESGGASTNEECAR